MAQNGFDPRSQIVYAYAGLAVIVFALSRLPVEQEAEEAL